MIKILKPGHGDFKEAFCKHCGCEFAYQKWDAEAFTSRNGVGLSIKCPTCHKKIFLGEISNAEWLKHGMEGKLC